MQYRGLRLLVHEIRLRLAWTCRVEGLASRIDLPIERHRLPTEPFTLERSYRAPALAPGEWIRLSLRDAPGVEFIQVDGQAMAVDARLPLGGPHRIEVRVSWGDSRERSGEPLRWGDLRIEVHRAEGEPFLNGAGVAWDA